VSPDTEKEDLRTYLSMKPTIDFDSERKLEALHDLVAKHWELEAIGLVEKIPTFSGDMKEKPVKHWSKSEIESDEKLKVTYLEDQKQFQMSIPWKKARPDLPNNRFEVLSRQTKVFAKYSAEEQALITKQFDSYLQKGYIRKLEPKEKYDADAFYLPFFWVVNSKSETTPVRIVWDCAAKFGHHGVKKSLNSEIELTPNRLQDLFKLLLRMRKFKNVILSDISEMFLKVLLDPDDRRYHRFHFNGEEYEWLVILFGNLSSPNGSQKVIQLNCDLHGEGLEEALESVRNSCYMDDVADSRPEEERALKLAQELVRLFGFCGMKVQKFYSNSDLVCKNKNFLPNPSNLTKSPTTLSTTLAAYWVCPTLFPMIVSPMLANSRTSRNGSKAKWTLTSIQTLKKMTSSHPKKKAGPNANSPRFQPQFSIHLDLLHLSWFGQESSSRKSGSSRSTGTPNCQKQSASNGKTGSNSLLRSQKSRSPAGLD
jgi:hypothetical protein